MNYTGETTSAPFAHWSGESASWTSVQTDMFDSPGSVTWPRWGGWDEDGAFATGPSGGASDGPAALLPTPCAMAPNDGEDPDSWLARAQRLKKKHNNGNGAGMPLSIAVRLVAAHRLEDRNWYRPARQCEGQGSLLVG